MIIGRSTLAGLLLVLAGVGTGCSAPAEAGFEAPPADVAVPSDAAAGAPGYCSDLAGSTSLSLVPSAVAALDGGSGEVEARFDLTAAIDELRTVLAGVEDAGGQADLEAALHGLIDTLGGAAGAGNGTPVPDGVAEGLDEVGRLVQPVCRFPS